MGNKNIKIVFIKIMMFYLTTLAIKAFIEHEGGEWCCILKSDDLSTDSFVGCSLPFEKHRLDKLC